MSPEEADKKIEFILQMQAQFEVNLAKLEANLNRSEANIDKLRDSQAILTASVVRIAEILEQSIRHTDERFFKFDQRMAELREAQKATDDRLNVLINIVERHVTGPDHGRKAQ